GCARAEVLRVRQQQRTDEQQDQQLYQRDQHQDQEPLHRRAPTPRTIALTSISTTPNAAATPVSDSRRLERISMDTGRVSYVYRTMDATMSPSAATNARLAPAASPGRSCGNVTRARVRQRPAPRLAAASSSDGSSWRYDARMPRPVSGSPRT